MTETHAILQRMRELTVQAGNTGTQQTEDLTAIKDEMDALVEEIDGISNRTEFNGKKLLDGTETTGFTSKLVLMQLKISMLQLVAWMQLL
ncbi:hypothetical protein BSAF29S_05731 [Bacillus safensis subsp. safensis]